MSSVPETERAENTLEKFDPTSPEYIRDPYPTYDRLRKSTCPVARSDQYGGFYLLSRYADVKDVARDTKKYTSTKGVTLPPVGNPMPFLPIELDPPEHTKYRRVLQSWFSPREMAKLEEPLRAIVTELIDEFVDRGEADFVEELSGPLPPIVIALLLGLPREDWAQFRSRAETLVQSAEVEDADAGAAASMELLAYLGERIEERKQTPADDMLTKMINIEIDGEPISSDAVLGLAFFLLMAGHETTVGGLSMMLLHVATQKDVRERLLEDPDLIERAVEESLRLEPPIQTIGRTVTESMCLHGVNLNEGDKIAIGWGSANRDPEVFDDADEFDVDRPRNPPHVAFGEGVHRCLGSSLARLEMKVVLEEVLRRTPNYQVVEPDKIEVGGFLARHVRSMPVRW